MADKKITIHPIDNGEPDYSTNLYPKTTVEQVNGLTGALAGKQDSLTPSSVNDGTLTTNLGFDSNGNLVKGAGGSSGGATITFVDWTADGYEVQISFTNGVSTEYWYSTQIYDDYTFINNDTLYVNSSHQIGNISTANGTATVTTTTGKLLILGESEPSTESSGTITCSSNITNLGYTSDYDSSGEFEGQIADIYINDTLAGNGPEYIVYSFSVSGTGTITIDGADWSDN